MPTYVYTCESCDIIFEENIPYENRNVPTENSCKDCKGKIRRIPVMPGFAYDNIASPGHSKRPDSAFNDKLKEIKKTHYRSSINIIE